MKQIKSIEDWNNLLNKADKSEDDFLQIGQAYEYGIICKNNFEIKTNLEKAFEWYLKGSENNYCKIRVADLLSEGLGCEKNIQKSIELYTELISKNMSIAAFNLSTVYRDLGNYDETYKLLYKVFEIDNVYPIELAFHYLYGIGTLVNKSKAKELFLNVTNNKKSYSDYEVEQANYQLALFYIANNEIDHAKKLLLENDNEFSYDLLNIIGR
ncbi:tetratricopeptide repeat protein [Myroides sp. DW712]|uniref:tetratricopeptide repeat protein n=1 Tax=Myroides sp. DW712 TaxID=3389800 RepID=UPI00397E6538